MLVPWRSFCCALILISAHGVRAQEPVWSPDVATIIYENCSRCHHDGGIAPFTLMNFTDVAIQALDVKWHVSERHMPPWPADPDYRRFAHERVLTQEEIDAVVHWVDLGMPYGDPLLEPPPPVFPPNGSLMETIDHVVAIEPYTLQSNFDEYRWFVIETDFPDTVYVNQIEVIPGLPATVHHADISFDLSGTSLAYDLADPLPGFNSNTGSPNYSYYMNAWQPGGQIVKYPPDWGIAIPPGADFVLEIHYGPGAIGQTDTTKMNLRFVSGETIRPVYVGWLLGQSPPTLVDGPFVLPANVISTFHQQLTLGSSRSFLSICPHMHHLGKSYTVWFETPAGDSIPLIDIPQWDFHWQLYYTFLRVQPIMAGSTIKSIGVYDNTEGNPHNPFNPPQTVYPGLTTLHEMFLCYFIWTPYQPGDEDIELDPEILAGMENPPTGVPGWALYPTPTTEDLHVEPRLPIGTKAYLRLLDQGGRVLEERHVIGQGFWHAESFDLRGLPSGQYIMERVNGDERSSRRFIVH